MEKVRTGRLISIDYPAYSERYRQIRFDLSHFSWSWDLRSLKRLVRWVYGVTTHIPPNADSGWAVPNQLRDRWDLRQGESRHILPALEGLHPDLFIHDSDHTYANMAMEFEWAWPRLKRGGILMADDVGLNTAWDDFVKRHQPPYQRVFLDRLGVAVKS
jgi:hypothetical protein